MRVVCVLRACVYCVCVVFVCVCVCVAYRIVQILMQGNFNAFN